MTTNNDDDNFLGKWTTSYTDRDGKVSENLELGIRKEIFNRLRGDYSLGGKDFYVLGTVVQGTLVGAYHEASGGVVGYCQFRLLDRFLIGSWINNGPTPGLWWGHKHD